MDKVKLSGAILVAMVIMSVLIVALAFTDVDLICVYALTAAVLALLVVVIVLIISGRKIAFEPDEGGFRVSGPLIRVTVPYASVSSVELRNSISIGVRTWGYGGVRYAGGNFANKEFGTYKLAVDARNKNFIVVAHSGKTLVFNLGTEDETLMAYNAVKSRLKL
ncbi:MAG: PH domain-containing protein [Candidatus Methanoplasma sp.]|jgi:hypothetical protein|nr:PH domain-containing protein [Candidatus Methanoplasma sp.]